MPQSKWHTYRTTFTRGGTLHFYQVRRGLSGWLHRRVHFRAGGFEAEAAVSIPDVLGEIAYRRALAR